MTPAMYIFVNKGLGMSTGKTAAQAAHAAVEAYRISMSRTPEGRSTIWPHMPAKVLYETNEVRRWYRGGHYMKLVMECRDDAHILATEQYLKNRGFNTALIYDEGHTEIPAVTPTALGVEIVDKDNPHVQASFGCFDLYREAPVIIESTGRMKQADLDKIRQQLRSGMSPQRIREKLIEEQQRQRPSRSSRLWEWLKQ